MINARSSFSSLLIGLSACLLCSCTVNQIAVRTTADVIEAGTPAFYEESDPKLAQEAMPAQLKLLEVLLRSDPDNPQLLKALAQGYVGYSFLFLEDTEPERARELYHRALGYGLRLAERDKAFADLARMPVGRLSVALKSAKKDDVPGLYWTAYAWAAWANLAKDDPEALSGASKAARIMQRVLELAPNYEFGGPDIFFGIYYAARPRLAGGDLDKAKTHFTAAIERTSGRFLTAKLLYAKYYAVAALDSALFRKLNEEILGSRADILPAARLANEAAKQKSKRLMEKIDELF